MREKLGAKVTLPKIYFRLIKRSAAPIVVIIPPLIPMGDGSVGVSGGKGVGIIVTPRSRFKLIGHRDDKNFAKHQTLRDSYSRG